MLLGAHIGISRGLPEVPVYGASIGCDVVQIFSKNQMQWKVPHLSAEAAEGFRTASKAHLKGPSLIHTSYLLNVASMDDELWKKSVDGLVVEIERAEALGIPWVVFHPGSPKEKGREWGCTRVGAGVTEALRRTKGMKAGVLLETNAGAGNAVGRTFDELASMLDCVETEKKRAAVCVDTCHVFVSGIPVHEEKGYEEAWQRFDDVVGLDRIACFHLNDAKAPFGSNKDRHEQIGKGLIGEAFWRRLVHDPRWATTPGYLETPEGEDGYPADLAYLRKLVA